MARAVRPGVLGNFAAPEFAEARALGGIGEMRVAGQAVGQNAHVGSAAGIRIIAEGHEFRLAAEARAERDEIANRGALNIRAEENDDIAFGFERRFQLHQSFGGCGSRIALVRLRASATRRASAPSATSTANRRPGDESCSGGH